MRYQKTPYFCGPAAVQNGLFMLGAKVSQDRLALAGGTTELDGTNEEGIKRMLLSQGRGYDEIARDDDRLAWGALYGALLMGRPVVLCMDQWSHWVVAIGILGQRVVLFDPARYRHNTDRLGTFTLPRDRLLKRWKAGHRMARDQPAYYGIVIGDRS